MDRDSKGQTVTCGASHASSAEQTPKELGIQLAAAANVGCPRR
jgi:hypothetical protein